LLDVGAVGDQIDLLIEEAQKRDEQAEAAVKHDPQAAESPTGKDRRAPSPAQTR
jgi:hypothetical protein